MPGISPELLYAIARTESGLDPQAVDHNRNGSRDIGLMQINSTWLPRLSARGITERALFNPCTSIHVGAWILGGNVRRLGLHLGGCGRLQRREPCSTTAGLCRAGLPAGRSDKHGAPAHAAIRFPHPTATTHSKRRELESGYASRMRAIARDEGMWPEGLSHLLIDALLIEEIA